MSRVTRVVPAVLVVLAACGGSPKAAQSAAQPSATPAAAVPATDTAKAPTVTPVTAASKPESKAKETRLRDSVTLPIGMVDSNGKFVPLKKRP
jgi:hypothetical protein